MPNLDIFQTTSGVVKTINVALIIITVAIFYSRYGGWLQFVGTMLVSGLAYLIILLFTYVMGGESIKTTFYELFMNTYFALMFFIACITSFAHGYTGIEVTTGIFCMISFLFFSIDIYCALVNMGAFNRAVNNQGPSTAPPTNISFPPPTVNINSTNAFPPSVIHPSPNSEPIRINPVY